MWELPETVEVDGMTFHIRNKCDYKMVLDVINVLNDKELESQQQAEVAVMIFYEDWEKTFDITDETKLKNVVSELIKQMMIIINNGEETNENDAHKPILMNWEKDFKLLVAPISRVLGYDVRTKDKYTHWWTFLAGYMEIGECTFSNVVSIRKKRLQNKKLEKYEQEFYMENRAMIDLPVETNLTQEEAELLNSDW